jgi:hypothetical protein
MRLEDGSGAEGSLDHMPDPVVAYTEFSDGIRCVAVSEEGVWPVSQLTLATTY